MQLPEKWVEPPRTLSVSVSLRKSSEVWGNLRLYENLWASSGVFDAKEQSSHTTGLFSEVVGNKGHDPAVQVVNIAQVVASSAVLQVGSQSR